MGKGARNKNREKSVEVTPKKVNKKVVGIIALTLAVVMAVAAGLTVCISNGIFYRDTIAMESANYKVNVSMASYYFNEFCKEELEANGDYYYYYMGYDASLPLSEQYIDSEKKITLFKHLLGMSKDYVGEILIYAESARANGLSMGKEDYAKIDDEIEALKTKANEEGVSFGRYLKSTFGSSVREEDVRKCLELSIMSDKEYTRLENEFNPTKEEISEFYEENRSYIDNASYIYYTFNGSTAKQRADELKKCTTVNSFKNYIVEFMLRTGDCDSKADALKELEKYKSEKVTYSAGDEISTWLFKRERRVGDVHSLTNDNSYTVYMVTAAPAPDKTTSVNVRHIVMAEEKYGNSAATKTKADEILNEFIESGKSSDKFAELSLQYSGDVNTAKSGGLYENYRKGDVEEAYEFDDWCFDKARKAGDTEVIKTDYGVHIMYLESFGRESWEIDCVASLKEQMLNSAHTEYFEKYPVITTDNAFNNIKE